MIARRLAVLVLAALISIGVHPAAQDAGSSNAIQILSPAEAAYVTGPTVLRARVDATGGLQSVVFYVDGRQLCGLSHEPFECEWDAGPTIIEHDVRLVATFSGGRRVVKTVRTKGVG